MNTAEKWHGTTIVLLRKNGETVVAGDGQVSLGNTVLKSKAKKVRKIESRGVIAGFAGSTADALTLFERLEAKLEKHAGNLQRAAVELAKDWRSDKFLRRLEALMAVADKKHSFIISGTGDVLEPEDGIIGIGSGGNYALAAAKVLVETDMKAEDIARKSIKVASDICVFTNNNVTVEKFNMAPTNKVTNLKVVKKDKETSKVSALSPREIVSELDRYVIGQKDAKKAVAVALRNRWRRQALSDEMRDEVLPKNILMIGPTGVGKTEISRRLKISRSSIYKSRSYKVYRSRLCGKRCRTNRKRPDRNCYCNGKRKKRKEVKAKAELKAEEKVLDALVGNKASVATRESFRKRLRNGDLDNNEIEIEVQNTSSPLQSLEIPGMPGGNVGMVNLGDILGKSMGGKKGKKKKMTVKESHDILVAQESDKMIEEDKIITEAKKATEENGIVFLDEIDKVSARSDRVGGDVSREGVQRDLLPLIEGTTVSTKHGPIKTDHILFIASGAFQLAKPSDLLPELQGRLPIRVELDALKEEDFRRILKEPDNSLIKQYKELLKTENVNLEFKDDGIDMLAKISAEVNSSVENIGARRLHTIIEKVLDDISFNATDRAGETIRVHQKYVQDHLGNLIKDPDLSKFIL